MALLFSILQGALAGAVLGGAISGVSALTLTSPDYKVEGATHLPPYFAVHIMELQTMVGVQTTQRLVKLLDALCQLSDVTNVKSTPRVLLHAVKEAHRKRQNIHMEINRLWEAHIDSQSHKAAEKVQLLFQTIEEEVNKIVNNIDVTSELACGHVSLMSTYDDSTCENIATSKEVAQ